MPKFELRMCYLKYDEMPGATQLVQRFGGANGAIRGERPEDFAKLDRDTGLVLGFLVLDDEDRPIAAVGKNPMIDLADEGVFLVAFTAEAHLAYITEMYV